METINKDRKEGEMQ